MHVNVLCRPYTFDVATLQRSLVSFLCYMLLYAAEISGFFATLHVATLQRSLVSLLRNMGWVVEWGGGACMLTFSVVRTFDVATL